MTTFDTVENTPTDVIDFFQTTILRGTLFSGYCLLQRLLDVEQTRLSPYHQATVLDNYFVLYYWWVSGWLLGGV